METFDWKSSIRSTILQLKLVGLWPKGDKTYQRNLYTVYAFSLFIIFDCVHNFFQIVNLYFISDDLEAFSSSFFVIFSSAGTILKGYAVFQNMTNLKQVFVTLTEEIFQPREERQRELVQASIGFWKRVCTVFRIPCAFTLCLWTVNPILDKSYKEGGLPFLAWYPYDHKRSPLYQLTYVHQVISIYYIVDISVNTDCLIAALNMIIGAQCDILCDNLRNLRSIQKNKFKKNLVRCVIHHKAILRLAEQSNKFYNWIVLLQFFTSAVSLGFGLFRLTVVQPLSGQFYSFVGYAAGMTTELFLYCWFGNEVEIKSSAIPYAAFESEWIGAPTVLQKILVILTIKTQIPIKMSALGLFYLSLDTFKAILRTAWSYFTVLHQVSSN